MWSTLKVLPLLHDKLMSRCELHLVYLGFRIFLHLKRHLLLDININVKPILGHITSDNPDIMARLHMACIKEEGHLPGTTEQLQ